MSFKNIKGKSGPVDYNVDMERFNKQNNKAQMWLDNEVIKDSDPFVPMDTGTLRHSAITGTTLGSGEVVYDMIYARRLYYGTDFEFSTDKHPDAQAQWFEAAKALYKAEWIRTARAMAGGGE